ncbi:MAG: tRNA (adenosine(37)-N6)-threonylcarbamoyltransferase complex ATPase subunit type 1 TsaE [Spirochaetales bacterium]|nr:tRNA (adenosine(37)-N6)-threonylcarbamoyltransferase complex ATPase subunit type 1 TsaE [Spirochaetales bacterium]
MKSIYTLNSAEETMAWGQKFGNILDNKAIILLKGPMGAGKTTLTKGIARGMGIEEIVTSPTFTIISEYPGNKPLIHIDLYRLEGEDDFESIGLAELLDGPGVKILEWSEKLGDYIKGFETMEITFSILNDNKRQIETKGITLS